MRSVSYFLLNDRFRRMDAPAFLSDVSRLKMERRSAFALLGAIAKRPGGPFRNRKYSLQWQVDSAE